MQKKKVNFREYILGGQDGLVNVLGLVLGVAGATLNSSLVILSGLVATVAESVSMAAVAYTSSRAARDYYRSIVLQEKKHLQRKPQDHVQDLKKIYAEKGFKGKLLESIVKRISSDKQLLTKTLLLEKHKIFPEDFSSPFRSAWVVGVSTVIGSVIPLVPFFFFSVKTGITASLLLSGIILFVVGALKAKLSIGSWKRSGFELMIIGLVAALLGYGVGLLLKEYGLA